MCTLYYTSPLLAVKAANKYEAQGYIVAMTHDGDVVVVTVHEIISTADTKEVA